MQKPLKDRFMDKVLTALESIAELSQIIADHWDVSNDFQLNTVELDNIEYHLDTVIRFTKNQRKLQK